MNVVKTTALILGSHGISLTPNSHPVPFDHGLAIFNRKRTVGEADLQHASVCIAMIFHPAKMPEHHRPGVQAADGQFDILALTR